MIDSIRHALERIKRKPSDELVQSRIQSDHIEERVALTKKMLNAPQTLTHLDLAKLIDEAWASR